MRAAARIRARAKRLNSLANETLAKFRSKSEEVMHMTNSVVAKHLQSCAKKAYRIKCRRELSATESLFLFTKSNLPLHYSSVLI